jgi:hypothetical protein
MNDSAIAPFLESGLSAGEMMSMPWWEVQTWFSGTGKNDADVDRIFFKLSLAAILKHPVEYITHTIERMGRIPIAQPYLRGNFIQDFAKCRYDLCQNCRPVLWNNFTCWNKPICTPAVVSCTAESLWSKFVSAQNFLYPTVTALLFGISLIGSFLELFSSRPLLRWTSGIFLILLGFHAATEFVQGRFIIPMYPLYAVLLVYPLSLIWTKLSSKL